MDRRQYLSVLGVVAGSIAGCLGTESERIQQADRPIGTTTDSDRKPFTQSPTHSSTPTSEPQIDVPNCPEKPDEYTKETAAQFAVKFEKSYVARTIIRNNIGITSVQFPSLEGIGAKKVTVTETDNGHLVHFHVEPSYTYQPDPTETSTNHADRERYTANYFVSDQRVLRAEAYESVDARENGSVVHCPPE